MIIGDKIIKNKLIYNANAKNLKNSTYDLTIGKIFPISDDNKASVDVTSYFIKPREIIWILSEEAFSMPSTVTGIATLRTTYTQQGLLALNVGIIDPLFDGPISTAIINFSNIPRKISVGDKFFRVAFFEHEKVPEKYQDEYIVTKGEYTDILTARAQQEYTSSFLNVRMIEDELYKQFWKLVWKGIWDYRNLLIGCFTLLLLLLVFLWSEDKIKIEISYLGAIEKISENQNEEVSVSAKTTTNHVTTDPKNNP